eukprot:Colp12_sorted_trinity150504_noHs@14174
MDSQNGTGGGHGGQSRRKDNIAPLSIDTTLIKAVPLTDQNDALKDLKLLGISVYDQSEFEAGVIAQVDEAIHTQQLAEVQAELNTLQTELRTLKASNVEVSAKLAKLASSIFPSNEQQKEMERLGKQKERQLRRLKDLMLQEKAANDYVMQTLMATTGVHSALDHDAVMDGTVRDLSIVQREALSVAKKAAEALRESRRLCMQSDVGTPTWTGRSGEAGIKPRFGAKRNTAVGTSPLTALDTASPARTPDREDGPSTGRVFGAGKKEKPTAGPSSADLLARMRRKKAGEVEVPVTEEEARKQLIGQMAEYLRAQGGRAGSKAIVDEFQVKLTPEDVYVFKAMLKEIARFDKKQSVWLLKDDYR